MTIKLSEEQMSKFGFSTQEEVIAALEKSKEKPQEKIVTDPALAAFMKTFEAAIALHGAAIEKLEASLKTVSPESILASASAEAKKVASSEVAAAIAKSGGAALTSKEKTDVEQSKKPAADDYAAQYDAESAENIRAEFPTKSSYVAYRTGIANGRIRSMSKTQTN